MSTSNALPSGVWLFPGFLKDTECEVWIRRIREKPVEEKCCFTNAGLFENDKYVDVEVADGFHRRLLELCECERNKDFRRANNLVMTARYEPGAQFSIHTDTGLYYNRREGERSRQTLLIYLNDDFTGGETIFYDAGFAETARIRPVAGTALLFDIDLWHKGEPVTDGEKYWVGCEIIGAL